MSTRKGKPFEPEPPLVQKLLAERRELLVSRERLSLELTELREARGRPTPALLRLERENHSLRSQLAQARTRLDAFEAGVVRAVTLLERAQVGPKAAACEDALPLPRAGARETAQAPPGGEACL